MAVNKFIHLFSESEHGLRMAEGCDGSNNIILTSQNLLLEDFKRKEGLTAEVTTTRALGATGNAVLQATATAIAIQGYKHASGTPANAGLWAEAIHMQENEEDTILTHVKVLDGVLPVLQSEEQPPKPVLAAIQESETQPEEPVNAKLEARMSALMKDEAHELVTPVNADPQAEALTRQQDEERKLGELMIAQLQEAHAARLKEKQAHARIDAELQGGQMEAEEAAAAQKDAQLQAEENLRAQVAAEEGKGGGFLDLDAIGLNADYFDVAILTGRQWWQTRLASVRQRLAALHIDGRLYDLTVSFPKYHSQMKVSELGRRGREVDGGRKGGGCY